jgi:hypothetical protein
MHALLGSFLLVGCVSSGTHDAGRIEAPVPSPSPALANDLDASPPAASLEPPAEPEPAPLSAPREPPVPAAPDVAPPLAALAEPPKSTWLFYRDRYDADHDGTITRTEYTRAELGFRRLDVDGDGVVTGRDFAPRWDGWPRVDEPQLFTYGEGGPAFGDVAPDFRLKSTRGEPLTLAQFRGKKPVVLVFGSFT